MSVKVKQGITKCLNNIDRDFFDEDEIRSLLILSREHLNNNSLIKEIAHFIAHIERTQGFFHRKINSRYTKFKLIKDHVLTYDIKEIAMSAKNNDEVSDFMLGGVSVEKIESRLFNVLYSDGLDDLPEDHLKKYTGLTKKEIKELFEKYYVKINGFHCLRINSVANMVSLYRNSSLSIHDPDKDAEIEEHLRQAEILTNNIKSSIDEIQKVIRGAIFFDSVFRSDKFKAEIKMTIAELVDKFGIDKKFITSIPKKSGEILLCIMTLLHDSKFTFLDRSEGRLFFCPYLEYNYEKAQGEGYKHEDDLYNNGVWALYVSCSGTLVFPLFVSELPIKKYLSAIEFSLIPNISSLSKIPWTTATRVEGILRLTSEASYQ